MAEYIDRERLLHRFNIDDMMNVNGALISLNDARNVISNFPAADVAPVVHGRWEYIPQTLNTLSQLRCPFCRWWSLDPSIDGAYNYCPNCGAKMDGDGV